MATPKIQVFGANLNPKDGHTPVKGVDYWTEEDKQEIVSETTAALEESMPIVPDWAQAETKPEYKYEEIKDKPTLVEDVGASLNTETNVLTIEVKDKAGNVIASTTVALPIGGDDLTNYVTFDNFPMDNPDGTKKAGVVKIRNDYGVGLNMGILRLSQMDSNQLTKEKIDAYLVGAGGDLALTGRHLYKGVKAALLCGIATWSEDDKKALRELLDIE